MTFFITSESSYEISNFETVKFEDELNVFFHNKNYGQSIKHISTIIICVSNKFESLHPIRRARIVKEKAKLGFEYKLDFERYKNAEDSERVRYILIEFQRVLTGILTSKKIKDFDVTTFLNDLNSFVVTQNLSE